MRIIAVPVAIALFAITSAFAAPQIPLMPGQWESKSVVTSVEVPGASAAMIKMMKGKPTVISYCLTPQDAAKGPEKMLNQTGMDCHYTTYTVVGSHLNAVLQCKRPDGNEMTITTNGTFTPTSYSTKATMVTTGKRGMKLASTGSGKRLGPCKPAGEAHPSAQRPVAAP